MFALIRKVTLASLASAALMGLTLAAHADTITLTNVTIGTSNSPSAPSVGTITGSVNVDASTGLITSFNASVNIAADGRSYSFVSNSVNQIPESNGIDSTQYFYNASPAGADTIHLSYLNIGTVLCTETTICLGATGQVISGIGLSNGGSVCGPNGCTYTPARDDGNYFLLTGSIGTPQASPVAATPEPSSLVLLGTGILGFAGAARRRFLSA